MKIVFPDVIDMELSGDSPVSFLSFQPYWGRVLSIRACLGSPVTIFRAVYDIMSIPSVVAARRRSTLAKSAETARRQREREMTERRRVPRQVQPEKKMTPGGDPRGGQTNREGEPQDARLVAIRPI